MTCNCKSQEHLGNFGNCVKCAPKPHVHAELIKAWADGAKIQRYYGKWEDCFSPTWDADLSYRIKPEPKPDTIVNTIVDVNHSWRNVSIRCQWEGDVCPEDYKHNLDRVHVRYVFDGETGELKDVKLI